MRSGCPHHHELRLKGLSDGSVVAPLDFVPVAESSGAIIEIGNWVIRTAATDLAAGTDLDRTDLVSMAG